MGRPPLPAGSTCLRCTRELVQQGVWMRADADQRAEWKRDGKARAVRINMCTKCHQYLREHGELERHTAPTKVDLGTPETPSLCVRCGGRGITLEQLCRDCADVTYDLGERALWIDSRATA